MRADLYRAELRTCGRYRVALDRRQFPAQSLCASAGLAQGRRLVAASPLQGYEQRTGDAEVPQANSGALLFYSRMDGASLAKGILRMARISLMESGNGGDDAIEEVH